MKNEGTYGGLVQETTKSGKKASEFYPAREAGKQAFMRLTFVIGDGSNTQYLRAVAYGVLAEALKDSIGRYAEVTGYQQNKKGLDGKYQQQLVVQQVRGTELDTVAPKTTITERVGMVAESEEK